MESPGFLLIKSNKPGTLGIKKLNRWVAIIGNQIVIWWSASIIKCGKIMSLRDYGFHKIRHKIELLK